MNALDAALVLVVVYLLVSFSRSRLQNNRMLPPGPKGLPVVGNLFDLPKGPEGNHWAKHKKLYGVSYASRPPTPRSFDSLSIRPNKLRISPRNKYRYSEWQGNCVRAAREPVSELFGQAVSLFLDDNVGHFLSSAPWRV